jgi:hypothetical protein
MNKFKIVFLDGAKVEVKALNFSTAYVLAAHSRVKSGDATAHQLLINTKASCVVLPGKRKNRKQK